MSPDGCAEAPAMSAARQTRSAVEQLGCNASEDVLGTALNFNRDIEQARIWRRRWYAEAFFHPGVDTVTLIAIPTCR